MRNPIQVVSKLLEEEMKGSSPLGFIPPMYVLDPFSGCIVMHFFLEQMQPLQGCLSPDSVI